ncbi:hypothetical protein O4H52_22430, partial [Sphingomonadaceae bacterium G21617-S1]|nr:hypothetical protein [Sphingomonadaceae bacterium G21617-S1]
PFRSSRLIGAERQPTSDCRQSLQQSPLAQYERALTRERVMAGLAAAKRRGRQGGRPPMIDTETLERITAALDGGASKASVCRTFKVPRSTLIGTLARIGWAPPARA